MDGSVAKLVLDSLDSMGSERSGLSTVFQNYINSLNKEMKESETVLSDKDAILAKKLKFLKSCEESKDLGWFDYDSWNSLTKKMQIFFSEKIETLFYSGVFFQYSKLVEIEPIFWKMLPTSHSITVLGEGSNYHVHCIGDEGGRYDKLGDNKIRSLQKEFKSKIIRSIGITIDGEVIEKVGSHNV